MNIGIIGCGTIGSKIAEISQDINEITFVYLLDRSYERSKNISKLNEKVIASKSINDFIENVNLVIEAASQNAVRLYASKILEKGKAIIYPYKNGRMSFERLVDFLGI